ncbi:MAG: methyl-accepting chemotaxis protein [Proteobacteria bacterium]|nr:methyl-accepting chemotaxis protein [Pseudomonadota bacterium]
MKLKTKFICLGATLVVIVFMTEWLNYKDSIISNQQKISVELIQRHMDSDMKHDGIRGNVYSAMVAMKTGDTKLYKESADEVKNMSADFVKNTDLNIATDIPDDIRAQFVKIKESVITYASYSQKISQQTDFDSANAMLPEFNKVFSVLEEDQDKATDMILAWSQALHKSSEIIGTALKIALICLFIIAIGLPVYAMFSIFNPLNAMMQSMQSLSKGDTSITIPYSERKDEMGDMARTVQVFKDNALRIELMNKEAEQLKIEAEKQKRASMNKLADSFELSVTDVVSQVATAATQMQSGAQNVTGIAEDTKKRSNLVVTASNEAAHMSTQVAAASEEMTNAIREISAQTQKSSQIAAQAAETAKAARTTIDALSDKSNNVSEVIEVITDIAGQINLLALNATIESARAGDAGKGFSVVASEVKNLASQVAKATEEITFQISEMQSATKSSVESVVQIVGIIDQVTASASAVASAVEEQSAVMTEIAQNVSRTSTSTQEISRNMVEVERGAEKTGTTAMQVLESAKNLNQQSGTLKQRVADFLHTIRSA